jgi:KDO2-lipid IV(A) lauroyltransferase
MIKKSFSYIGIFFLKLIALLPMRVLQGFATISYYIIYYILEYRKEVVQNNLTNSFPEKSATEIRKLKKAFFRYFADLIFEVVKLSNISEKELNKRVKFNNLELVTNFIDKEQSILACTGHYGNWELGIMALGLKVPAKAYVIYKPLNNEIFDRWLFQTRTKTGNLFIPMRQTLRSLAATRNQTTMLCFAGDQTPIKDEAKVWIDFLNQPTAVIVGVEKIAFQTDRPVVYFNMQRVRRGYYEVDCHLVADKPSLTSEYQITKRNFALLEQIINKEPAYWLWSHRRWKHKPVDAVSTIPANGT